MRALCWTLLRTDGTIHLHEVGELGATLGFSDQQVRHAVRRLCEREGFVREGRGRHAVARITGTGDELWELDRELVAFAHRRDAGLEPWDGRWRLVTFSVPEHRRADRDRLRGWLREMGGAAVSQATYVSANDWWEVIEPLVAELALADHVTWGELDRLVVAGIADPVDIARHLWPPAERETAYQAARRQAEDAFAIWADLDDRGRLQAWAVATIALIEPFESDPLVPLELSGPDRTEGPRARQRHRDLTRRFLADVPGATRYTVALELASPD